GRTFLAGEPNGAVLSDRLWRSRFNADSNVLGKAIRLDSETFVVAGVMPAAFEFPARSQISIPPTLNPNAVNITLQAIARTKPGVTRQQAGAEMAAIVSRLSQRPNVPRLVSLQESIVKNVRRSLAVFLGAVGFLLLIACVNVANLLIARGARRAE